MRDTVGGRGNYLVLQAEETVTSTRLARSARKGPGRRARSKRLRSPFSTLQSTRHTAQETRIVSAAVTSAPLTGDRPCRHGGDHERVTRISNLMKGNTLYTAPKSRVNPPGTLNA